MSSLVNDPPSSSRNNEQQDDDYDIEIEIEDEPQIDQLIRLWRNERSSPELLPHNTTLLDSLVSLVAQQSAAIEPLRNTTSATPTTTTKPLLDPLDYFRLTIVQLDLDRINWLLRALVRCRMYKIEKFAHYLLQDPSERIKLSSLELEYAQSYRSLLDEYYHTHVLAGLPEQLRFTTNPEDENDEMLVRPNFDEPVFARVRRSGSSAILPECVYPSFLCHSLYISLINIFCHFSGRMINLRKGSTHLLRYSSIRRLLDTGVVELV